MINISTTFSTIYLLHKFPYKKIFLHITLQKFWILSSNIKTSSISLFYEKSSNVIFFFSKKNTISKEKKEETKQKKRKYEMKKRRRQKERRKENEEKKKERNKESEKKETNMGKISLPCKYLSLPFTSIPFHFPPCLYQVYHSTPSLPFSINPFLPSSSTSFGRIIRHQWYLSLYIISNLFICWFLLLTKLFL